MNVCFLYLCMHIMFVSLHYGTEHILFHVWGQGILLYHQDEQM